MKLFKQFTNWAAGVAVGALMVTSACGAGEPVALSNAATAGQSLSAAKGERYIVTFNDYLRGRSDVKARGLAVARELRRQNAMALHLPEAALKRFQNDANVAFIERDQLRKPLAQTVPYGIDMVQAPALWGGADGAGIKVCIIDSGFYTGHADLQNSAIAGYPGDWNSDECGHGSHVGGTIAALNNSTGVVGVLPKGVNLHIIKVFGGADCAWSYASDLVDALNRCEAAGANVVSMSLGGSFKSRAEDSAFAAAYGRGVLSIAAAGNDGNTRMSYPASYDSVVSVAAVDSSMNLASFSQRNAQVELAAPGVDVLSTVPWNSEATLTVDGMTYQGSGIEFAATSNGVKAPVADGGDCSVTGNWGGKVVMCERGAISFYDKVINVEAAGGVAAVIYNNAPGGFAGTLGAGNTSKIPAISLSQEDGQWIATNKIGFDGTVVNAFSSPGSGYEAWGGTSMATPHVSGVAALVWSQNPAWTNVEIRDALAATAFDLGAAGRDASYGFGLVQAKAAVDYLSGGITPPPPANQAPRAQFTYSCTDLACDFTDTSSDADGSIVGWAWDFGDGNGSAIQNPTMAYAAAGSYTVTLTVTDDAGDSASVSADVTVTDGATPPPPPAGLSLSAAGYKVKGKHTVELTWSGASSADIDIYRDGAWVTTVGNSGAYSDFMTSKGRGSYTYEVCEAGTATCSNSAAVKF